MLGRCSIISEKCVIDETRRIGDYVLIEAGCTISAKEIGDDCVIESVAVLGERSVIGNNCRICAGEVIGPDEVIPDGTVVYGGGWRRKDRSDQVQLVRRVANPEFATEDTRETLCVVQYEPPEGQPSLAERVVRHH